MSCSTRLNFERLNNGRPLISADPSGWDDGFTLNPTAVRLERSSTNDRLIQRVLSRHSLNDPKLQDGVIVVYYRGIPTEVPGRPTLRSSVGLAVFTPGFELLERLAYPVVVPGDDPMGYDYNGVEDQRVTRIGDTFYMVYCGYNPNLPVEHNIRICMAVSQDMVNWTKLGPVEGDVNSYPNKDAVIMSDTIDGKYVMLHRPMVGHQGEFNIALAIADSPTGEWQDIGTIMRAASDPRYHISWLGAGSAPLSLGNNRYLLDYHTGNYYATGERDYQQVMPFSLQHSIILSEAIVEGRADCLIEPETPYNFTRGHVRNLNCVFPAGSCVWRRCNLFYGGLMRMSRARFKAGTSFSHRGTRPGAESDALSAA